jgi:hypothetical protein
VTIGLGLLLGALLSAGCSQRGDSVPDYNHDERPPGEPWILALPNRPKVGFRERGAKTLLTWDTTQGFAGSLYVSVDGGPEKYLFSGPQYFFETVVQKGHTYDFRLYGTSPGSPLTSVKVRCE